MKATRQWIDFVIMSDNSDYIKTFDDRLRTEGVFRPLPPDFAIDPYSGLHVVTYDYFRSKLESGDQFECAEFGDDGSYTIWTLNRMYFRQLQGVCEYMDSLPRNPPNITE
jgi:hypothetical protein